MPLEASVRAANGAPTAAPDTAYDRVGRAISADVLGNDTDPEADIDPWSVRVVTPGALPPNRRHRRNPIRYGRRHCQALQDSPDAEG